MKRIKGPKIKKQNLKRAKIRITTYIDQDLLKILRELAEESGSKYQAVLNQILRGALLGKKEGLIKRIERLEKAVFRKKAA